MKKFLAGNLLPRVINLIKKQSDNRNKFLTGMFTLLMLGVTAEAHAIPVWSITPLTNTSISLTPDDTANISYLVTNNSRRIHTLVMQPIQGISQVTTPGNCPNPFLLPPKGSCVLNLFVNGRALPDFNIVDGPNICNGFNQLECYRPCSEGNLNIRKGYSLSVEVTGMSEVLTLLNNGADPLVTETDGFFTFNTLLANGSTYSVTVQSVRPEENPLTPIETCTVINGSGRVNGANINNVKVFCAPHAFTIGGNITGIAGSVTLSNAGQLITVSANGNFTFPTPVADGSPYEVSVQSQPAGQICTVSNGEGIVSGANISNVQVTCSANAFTVGGQVSNLVGTVTLVLNGEIDLAVSQNGSFTFPTPIAQGSPYFVGVEQHPAGQTCDVSNASGTMGSSNVTNVTVTCLSDTTTLAVSQQLLTVPVGGLTSLLTVTNTGANPATNVHAQLPSSWVSVIQDSSACNLINPGASCNLIFSSTVGYVASPTRVDRTDSPFITGDNIDNAPQVAIAFTISSGGENYLIWDVASSGNLMTYKVIDNVNVASNVPWSTPIVQTNVTDKTNGAQNTVDITMFPSLIQSAAASCYASGNGGASTGTWYLPAICQMGTPGNAQCNQLPMKIANFNSNLIIPGFGMSLGLIPLNQPPIPAPTDFFYFWSSTENSATNAWGEAFATNGSSPQLAFAKGNGGIIVRCAREFTL